MLLYWSGAGMRKGYYIRVGDANEPMSSFEIYNLFSYKDRIQDDLRPIERAKLEDLDIEKAYKYIDKMRKDKPNFSKLGNNQCLEKLGIVCGNDNAKREVTTDTLVNNKHDIRNKNLVRILEDTKAIENRGLNSIYRTIEDLVTVVITTFYHEFLILIKIFFLTI